jgi:class I lanthipeptide synthase
MSNRWRPVLERDVRQSALDTVASIARELRHARVRDSTLAMGQSGIALLFAYLGQHHEGADEEFGLRLSGQAAHAVAHRRMSASFYSGFTGVGWATIHSKKLLNLDGPYPNREIDRALGLHLRRSPWRGEYDLVSGLTGLGVYALEALPNSGAVTLLKRIVAHLDKSAERSGESFTWLSRPDLPSADWRNSYPNGCYNLGLAHGVPGVIALLGRICATSENSLRATRTTAAKLLNGAMRWLLAQRSGGPNQSVFPILIGATGEAPAEAPRIGWCYGDLGIAAAVFLAARCVGHTVWTREALRWARQTADPSRRQRGVHDAGLCHGAAGIAHLFNRFYQATGEKCFRDSARDLFRRTLEMRRPGPAMAGFPARFYKPKIGNYWSPQPGLLYGATGVALALLSAATAAEPVWDRILLISN